MWLMSALERFLGISKLPVEARYVTKIFLFVFGAGTFILSTSSTFVILYTLEYVSFATLGVLLAVRYAVQAVLDYPSGALGDWLGQKTVIIIAFSLYTLFLFILGLADNVVGFAIAYVLFGIAMAQVSGAIQTWFDNNYQNTVGDSDPQRTTYGFFFGRSESIIALVSAAAFMVGGFGATFFSRRLVFQVQGLVSVFYVIFVALVLKNRYYSDEPTNDDSLPKQSNFAQYWQFLRGGVAFVFSGKREFFFIMGMVAFMSMWSIWGELILFPLYFGYTGSDILAGTLRTGIFLLGIPSSIVMASVSQKFTNEKWVWQFHITHAVMFFGLFAVLLWFVPLEDKLSVSGLVGTILIILVFNSLLVSLVGLIRQKIILDLIPAKNRNAIYSFVPTLVTAISAPMMIAVGWVIEHQSWSAGLLIVGLVGSIAAFMFFLSLRFRKKIPEESMYVL